MAVETIPPSTILTHSKFATAKTTIQMNEAQQLFLAESLLECEGIKVAEDIKSVDTVKSTLTLH